MFLIFEALLPIFILVMLGVVFKRWQFPASGFWVTADRITYYVFLPALIIEKLATTVFSAKDFYTLTGLLIIAVLAMAVLVVAIKKLLPVSPSSFTSVFQGSIRPNTYVALAAAVALFGPEALGLTAMAMAGVIPLVNILCILSFSYYVPSGASGRSGFLKSVISNPLVIACGIGIILNVTGIGLPYISGNIFKILASAALPMGLISVGTGLQLRDNKKQLLPIAAATVLKLILLPIMTYYLFTFMGIEDIRRSLAILFTSVPCAISSYILAGHLNGDQKLMASIITLETLLAFLTMPIILALLT